MGNKNELDAVLSSTGHLLKAGLEAKRALKPPKDEKYAKQPRSTHGVNVLVELANVVIDPLTGKKIPKLKVKGKSSK